MRSVVFRWSKTGIETETINRNDLLGPHLATFSYETHQPNIQIVNQ
jgi:hypothetical protein